MRIIVGITGASGSIYGVRLIECLKNLGHEVHVVMTDNGVRVTEYECGTTLEDISRVADVIYDNADVGAAIASGSFRADAMVVVPCSMKSVASIATGVTDNLLTRAADVMLKEGRRLIIVPRETPMHAGHLENLLKLARLGARVIPASPGFYHKPETIMDLVDMLVGKICDSLGIDNDLFKRWEGDMEIVAAPRPAATRVKSAEMPMQQQEQEDDSPINIMDLMNPGDLQARRAVEDRKAALAAQERELQAARERQEAQVAAAKEQQEMLAARAREAQAARELEAQIARERGAKPAEITDVDITRARQIARMLDADPRTQYLSEEEKEHIVKMLLNQY